MKHQMTKTRTLSALALLIGLFAMFAVAGCGSDDDSTATDSTSGGSDSGTIDVSDATLIKDGQLLVGTDAPYPPFEIGTPEGGDFSGFDKDLMDAIADKLGLTPTYQNSSFDTIFRDVASGQFDIVAAAATITPEREKVVTFSRPYYEAQQALVVPEGSDITSTDQLSGQVVGVQQGTTGQDYAENETDAKEVRGFAKGADALAAVTTEQVAAAIVDQPFAADAVNKQGGIEIAQEISTDEVYGFAMAPDNKLVDGVNEAIQQLIDDGTLNDLYQQYFSTDAPDSVVNGGK
ncbi:MAG: amino acid ABC transporter substrate-binding protein [Solirubrobacterales bacterium]|nr:amino acid ABC transporter substrate-binding protein [Solirubrobacterales bacterium]MCB8969551.1 amino acid ABC transporter substrate-binding protein [Thermoleophilales bacterium]MCO5326608.1 ABC transporter substrate-binding protein [Solirubrobacterales bacterium]